MKWFKLLISLFMFKSKNQFPDTIICDRDGWEMQFVSVEMGYSCRNPRCVCHIDREEA